MHFYLDDTLVIIVDSVKPDANKDGCKQPSVKPGLWDNHEVFLMPFIAAGLAAFSVEFLLRASSLLSFVLM